ncbi:hypothetical protein DAPPUDRAFT_102352 [Daphnia pulex]|uniref:Uncharacterized protein n=1 Tax=Daphnia pulex TaxID=6669 RepID=E9GG74_DAPPU|nr:hypothetical protein DAPPUDRAFT_102352 [Daphnia pulex]|eukprot:EFX81542.1 hypothetical protein DAPPUDRAFT_102352 [Daphnia pulex]
MSSSSSNQTPAVVLICIGLALLLLSGASSFHLNDQNVSSEVIVAGEDGDVESCSSGDWAVQIPDLNFQIPGLLLKTGGNANRKPASLALVEDSKALQTWLLQITQQVASALKLSNTSATQLQLLVANVENQFQEVNRALNSSELIVELIAPPLTNITESTKAIAQLFYLMTSQFEELFNLTRAVKNSAVKIRDRLERAHLGVIKRKASRINSRRKLKLAIQSLRRTIADLTRRLQRDRVELKTTTQEWQALKSGINFTQDGEWANVKARLERAKWRWNCSRQALNKTQEKLHKWSQLDEELAVAIEESRQESAEIHDEMVLLLNGTRNSSSSSVAQLERNRNLTTDFAHYYSDAGGFFLGIGSRISNILAGIVLSQRIGAGEALATLRSHLKKVKCDLDRNGRFIILTDAGKSPKKDVNDNKRTNIVGFLLGAAAATKENCDGDFPSLRS